MCNVYFAGNICFVKSTSYDFFSFFSYIFSHVKLLNVLGRGSVRVQRAQFVVRLLAVRQARFRISARHPMEVPPTEPTAVKKWRWASANVYERLNDV